MNKIFYTITFITIIILAGCSTKYENIRYQGNYAQGIIQVKIGEQTLFTNGPDIIGVESLKNIDDNRYFCYNIGDEGYICNFHLSVKVNDKVAQKFSDLTNACRLIEDPYYEGRTYLSEDMNIFYKDEKFEPIRIGPELQGKKPDKIDISGSSIGKSEQEANMLAKTKLFEIQKVLKDEK